GGRTRTPMRAAPACGKVARRRGGASSPGPRPGRSRPAYHPGRVRARRARGGAVPSGAHEETPTVPLPRASADAVDLSQLDFWVRPEAEREAAFAALRRERPISFHAEFEPPPGVGLVRGPGYWALVRHADILAVGREPGVSCSGPAPTTPDLPEAFNEFSGSMTNRAEPRHGRLRRIVSRGFTPRALARLEADVERRARQTIDRVIDRGECDFV